MQKRENLTHYDSHQFRVCWGLSSIWCNNKQQPAGFFEKTQKFSKFPIRSLFVYSPSLSISRVSVYNLSSQSISCNNQFDKTKNYQNAGICRIQPKFQMLQKMIREKQHKLVLNWFLFIIIGFSEQGKVFSITFPQVDWVFRFSFS